MTTLDDWCSLAALIGLIICLLMLYDRHEGGRYHR